MSAEPTESSPPTPVPTDLEQVAEMLRTMMSEGRFDEAIALVLRVVAKVRDHNNRLEQRLAYALRMLYGRRSEKIDPAQLALMLKEGESNAVPGTEPANDAAAPADTAGEPAADPAAPGRKNKHKGRSALPAHLPREVHRHSPSDEECTCALCGKEKDLIGVERSEMLDYRPASLFVRVDEREKLACRPCEKDVVIAPAAPKPIEKGRPGPGLLAQVLVAKFEDHQPLHRQSRILTREGVHISDSTLGDWSAAGAELLEPIAAEIRNRALASFILQADATGIDVLDRKHPNHKRLGSVWVAVGDRQYASFVYAKDGKGQRVAEWLAGRDSGYIQGDGDGRLDRVCEDSGGKLIKVGCWMHGRRYVHRAFEAHDARAAVALEHIRHVYGVEEQANKDAVDANERARRRQEQSKPRLAQLRSWIEAAMPAAPPSTPMGRAVTYLLNQWDSLQVFLEDGRIPIDNGEPERQIRRVAMGRNNWWFAGSDRGATVAATAWTVLGTCALQGVPPWQYLRWVFEQLSDRANPSPTVDLLPAAYLARQSGSSA